MPQSFIIVCERMVTVQLRDAYLKIGGQIEWLAPPQRRIDAAYPDKMRYIGLGAM